MDDRHCPVRPQMEIQDTGSKRPILCNQITCISGKKDATDKVRPRPVTKGSHSGSSNIPKVNGILLPVVSGEEEIGGSTPCLRSKESQSLNLSRDIQNGEPPVNSSGHEYRGLDAYLHVPIHISFQKFLRFAVGLHHFQFRSLPFGISTAPRTFTKILLSVIALLREQVLRVHHYLDDILLLADNQDSLLLHRSILITTLQNFGWIINWGKSNLQPTQRMIFLGAELDTRLNTVELPQEKIPSLIQKARKLLASTTLPAREYLSILGSFSATIPMVQWAQWNTRPLQASLLKQWNGVSLSQPIVVQKEIKQSLWWWTRLNNLKRCRHIVPLPQEIITSEASLKGWGAHYRHHAVQGLWTFRTQNVVSNILEMKAAFQALLAFSPLLRGKEVLLKLDNRVAVAYINRQGGTRSRSMMREVFEWAQLNLSGLTAAYVPGVQNQLADSLSRTFVSNNEWALSHQAFTLITQTWGIPDIDLAATPVNTPLIPRFLLRLKRSKATVLAVLPFWPRRPWFTTLLQLSTAEPLTLPMTADILSQGQLLHPFPERLHLTAWRLKGLGS